MPNNPGPSTAAKYFYLKRLREERMRQQMEAMRRSERLTGSKASMMSVGGNGMSVRDVEEDKFLDTLDRLLEVNEKIISINRPFVATNKRILKITSTEVKGWYYKDIKFIRKILNITELDGYKSKFFGAKKEPYHERYESIKGFEIHLKKGSVVHVYDNEYALEHVLEDLYLKRINENTHVLSSEHKKGKKYDGWKYSYRQTKKEIEIDYQVSPP